MKSVFQPFGYSLPSPLGEGLGVRLSGVRLLGVSLLGEAKPERGDGMSDVGIRGIAFYYGLACGKVYGGGMDSRDIA